MKYYMAFCAIGFGHASRCTAVAKELRQNGHDVVLCTYSPVYESDFSNKLRAQGYDIRQSQIEMTGKIKNDMLDTQCTFHDALTRYFTQIRANGKKKQAEILKEIKPDFVVTDGHIASTLAAKELGIPYYVILNQNRIDELIPKPLYVPLKPFLDRLFTSLQHGSQKIIIPDFPKEKAICRFNMQYFGPKLESKMQYVGPIVRKELEYAEPYKFEVPTIYVSLGGVNKVGELFNWLLPQIHRKTGIEFLVVNSRESQKKDGVRYIGFQENPFSYMKGSCAIITHGGHSTLAESLFCGVPVIGVTQEKHERLHNIQGLMQRKDKSDFNLGKLIMLDKIDEQLEDAVVDVTQNGYFDRVNDFLDNLEKQHGINAHSGLARTIEILTSKI